MRQNHYSYTNRLYEIVLIMIINIIFWQHWRNYIKPGFFLNAGDTFTNYDLALRENRIADITPGIESKNTFPHTQINAMPAEFEPKWYEASDVEHGDISSEVQEAIKSHFIISGFTWTAGLGHYQGYWQDDDIKSPITTQLILFDGKKFTFGGYQLNTLGMHFYHIPHIYSSTG